VHEREVKVGVALPADPEPSELVKPGEAALHNPALSTESRAVLFAAPGNQGLDAPSPKLAPVLVVVIAPVGKQPIGVSPLGERREAIDQGQELGDIVAVPAGQGDR
jgi:hypothetical protein